jgi:putative phage-type endonuclease
MLPNLSRLAAARDDDIGRASELLNSMPEGPARSSLYEAASAFFADQAAVGPVFFDAETTDLVREEVRISDMTVSVAVAIVVEAETGILQTYSFWNRSVPGRPIALLRVLLQNARTLVGYNARKFDLPLLGLEELAPRCFDPFARLLSETGSFLRLGDLLAANGLSPKTGTGSDAPRLWKEGRLRELAEYCARDVQALVELCGMPSIRLPSKMPSNGSAPPRPSRKKSRVSTSASLAPEHAQLTAAWFKARVGKITASSAGSLLGLSPFVTREAAFERLYDELHSAAPAAAAAAPTESQERGSREEEAIVAQFARATGLRVRPTGLHAHPEYPWLAASPDGLVQGLPLEVKSTRPSASIPSAHLVQVTTQMMCVGRSRAYYVQSYAGRLSVFDVALNKELAGVLAAELGRIYEEALTGDGDSPEVDPHVEVALKAALHSAAADVLLLRAP